MLKVEVSERRLFIYERRLTIDGPLYKYKSFPQILGKSELESETELTKIDGLYF